MYNNELRHYGVLGMKWGVRRYQNKDGSLTNAGRARYRTGDLMKTNDVSDSAITKEVKRDYNNMSERDFFQKYNSTKESYRKRVNKYGDPYRSRRLAKTGQKLNKKESDRALKTDAQKEAERMLRYDMINRSTLSDDELQERIQRLKMEKQLRELTTSEIEFGRLETNRILDFAGENVAKKAVTGGSLYGLKALVSNEFDRKEFGNAIFNGGAKKK